MSTARVLTVVGVCLLLAGCAPVTGGKSLIAIIAMVISVGAAAWGITHNRDEDRVVRKAEELDRKVDEHIAKYHRPPSRDTVVELDVNRDRHEAVQHQQMSNRA